jgi:hypothetical protein
MKRRGRQMPRMNTDQVHNHFASVSVAGYGEAHKEQALPPHVRLAKNADPDVDLGDIHEPTPCPHGDDKPVRVQDIKLKHRDSRGFPITEVYALRSNEYALYKAGEVMVHFADDPKKEMKQRKAILPLGRNRAELNYLFQGLRCREVCEHHIAHALELALEGDLNGAKKTMTEARTFLLGKRNARGRFQYLTWSHGIAATLILFLLFTRWYWPSMFSSDLLRNLWLAGQAGLVGAAFSIALAIRKRAVALDTERLANVTDGALRLSIGVISAGILLLFVSCHILTRLTLEGSSLHPDVLTLTPQMVLVIGFVGGFLERLVPDLLEKMTPQGNGGTNEAPSAGSIR